MINSNNDYNRTANTITSECFCPHKLPCGMCVITEKMCIKDQQTFKISCTTATNTTG
jgi:hypothetical protein